MNSLPCLVQSRIWRSSGLLSYLASSTVSRAVYLGTEHGQSYTTNRSIPLRDSDLAVSKIFFWRVDETFSERGKTLCWPRAKRACGRMYWARSRRDGPASSLRRIARSFRELESCRKRGAKADADRLVSSRVQSQSSFSRRFLEERIEKCCYRLRLAENFLERGRWQTNSQTFFVLKTNRLVLDGIRNTNSSEIFTEKASCEKCNSFWITIKWNIDILMF